MTAQLERLETERRSPSESAAESPAPLRDPRLHPVLRAIEDGSVRILSLDVFDTLLWRRVPEPHDLFRVVAGRLRAEGMLASWVSDDAFCEARRRAEHRARLQSGGLGSEVTLHAIWDQMPSSLFAIDSAHVLADHELLVEHDFTVLDRDVAALARAALRECALVLVSDTYLSRSQLRDLVESHGLPLGNALIFASSEYGVPKGEGLWESVVAELRVAPHEIVHVGDNEVADQEAPTRLGVRSLHYRRVDEKFAAVLEREPTSHDSHLGDRGLTTLRARAVSAVADSGRRTEHAFRYGAGVVGPALTAFAEWTVRRCAERGVQRVWCPMREGELLAELISNSAAASGVALTATPLWLSRHVTWLASIDRFDASTMRDVIRRSFGITVRSALGELGLRPGDVPALAMHLDRVLDDSEFTDRVASALVETSSLRHRLARAATERRDRLVRHLERSGALAEDEIVLVDLGWGGTIQAQLADVLRLAGHDQSVSGMYLATDERSGRLLDAGLRVEGFLGAAGHPVSVVSALTRSPEALEMCVNATCGSLLGFDPDGQPVLGAVSGGPSELAERRAVRTGILAFQARWSDYSALDPKAYDLTDDWARRQLGDMLRVAIRRPTDSEAELFGAWAHEDNLGSDLVTPLAPPQLVEWSEYLSIGDLSDLTMRDSFWPALLVSRSPSLRHAANLLGEDAASSEAFLPQWESYTRLMLHQVGGTWHPGPRKRVRINSDGLTFARLNAGFRDLPVDESAGPETRGIEEISLELPGRPAIVRVDRIDVLAQGLSGIAHSLRWETSADFAGLRLADCEWLGGTLLQFHSSNAAVVLPLALGIGEPVTSVRVTAGFAVLPMSATGLAGRARAASTRARLRGRLRAEFAHRGPFGVVRGAVKIVARRLGVFR